VYWSGTFRLRQWRQFGTRSCIHLRYNRIVYLQDEYKNVVCSSILLFGPSSIRAFVYSSIRTFVCSGLRLFFCSGLRLFVCSRRGGWDPQFVAARHRGDLPTIFPPTIFPPRISKNFRSSLCDLRRIATSGSPPSGRKIFLDK
jgi:hypothetical protein